MAAKDCVCKFIDHGNNSECIPTIKYSNKKKCRDHYRELSKDIPNAHKDYRDRVCDNFYKRRRYIDGKEGEKLNKIEYECLYQSFKPLCDCKYERFSNTCLMTYGKINPWCAGVCAQVTNHLWKNYENASEKVRKNKAPFFYVLHNLFIECFTKSLRSL